MADPIAVNPNALSTTIEFLTAMVTPTLLISATGSLVLSTSTRLGRVIDRVRELEVRLSDLIMTEDKSKIPLYEKRLDTVVHLLDKVTSRARILQRAMGAFYYGLGFFILTSVTIAVAAFFNTYRWIPIPVGIIGIFFSVLRKYSDAARNTDGNRNGQCRNGFYMGIGKQGRAEGNHQ
ncbi:MAG: DUF2721 domain-containing protein [Pyrinomonadaceae bacterium]